MESGDLTEMGMIEQKQEERGEGEVRYEDDDENNEDDNERDEINS